MRRQAVLYASHERVAGSYVGLVCSDSLGELWRCQHAHRSRQAAEMCAHWWISRQRRGLCACECHRDEREVYPNCCSCG
jgi:hypothetical protein